MADQKIGYVINYIDCNLIDKQIADSIIGSVYKHKVVVIKNQTLTTPQFNDLSYNFGEPLPYLQSNYHHPDFPLIFVSSNIKLEGKKIGVPRTGGYWHSDTAFLEKPIPLTLLYPQVIPKASVRTTMFIDLERVYEEMPDYLKKVLENAYFIHSGKWKYKVRKEDAGLDIGEIINMVDEVQPPVHHPAIITHPATRKKSIYATKGFTIGVVDMSHEESDKLLKRVFEFMEQERFISTFQWEIGDLIIWDNRFLVHKAGRKHAEALSPSQNLLEEEETMVFRIIINDGYPLSI